MSRVRRGAQPFDLQHRPASLVRRAHIELGQIAADHEPYHVVVGDLGARQFAGVFPIPQHRDPVGDFLHFTEPVRDIDDAHAARLKVLDHFEKLAGLALRQARGRLVHDQNAGLDR